MRLSQLFSKTQKTVPKDEVAINAQLLIRGGFIHKEMAGAYDYLPLGLKVIEKIKDVVREEMNALGSNEILMTSLQRQELWAKTDRWDDKKVDIWFKSALKNDMAVGLGWSHEEPISDMMKTHISSYRDLPAYVYQFQTKLRNELRVKSGIMRGREFLMKDLYSYTKTEKEHQQFYEAVTKAYMNVFKRVGLGDKTFFTFASGGDFTEFSHEFQTVCDTGEDTIYLDEDKKIAVNQEVMNEKVLKQLGLTKGDLKEVTAAEVGNIFSFGTTKSEQLGLYFTDEKGTNQPVVLGSYGIGISRLMGVLVELFHDGAGIIWPEAVAPAQVHLVALGDEAAVKKAADKLYEDLVKAGVETLYDDRAESAGVKLADADLIGVPQRLVVSTRTLEKKSAELKARDSKEAKLVGLEQIVKSLL